MWGAKRKKKTLLSSEKGVKCSYYTFFTYVGHACDTMRLFVTFGGRIESDDDGGGDGGLLSPSFYTDSACKLQVAFWGGGGAYLGKWTSKSYIAPWHITVWKYNTCSKLRRELNCFIYHQQS